MTSYVALLRAVNVGGTGKLPMADLRAMGEACGFAKCRTFIASGNLLFDSDLGEVAIKAALEPHLEACAGKHVAVLVRTAQELAAIVAADPFLDAIGSRHMVMFGDAAPPTDLVTSARDCRGERIALGRREVYVDYGDNIRDSRLKLALSGNWTARNINSVRKLALLAAG
jgi:uncharacterized protein (DUF1697 family)